MKLVVHFRVIRLDARHQFLFDAPGQIGAGRWWRGDERADATPRRLTGLRRAQGHTGAGGRWGWSAFFGHTLWF